jgi:hypothetical protein
MRILQQNQGRDFNWETCPNADITMIRDRYSRMQGWNALRLDSTSIRDTQRKLAWEVTQFDAVQVTSKVVNVTGFKGIIFTIVKLRWVIWKWMSECEWASRVTPSRGEWPVVDRPLLSSKRRPHLKTRKSLGKNKDMVTGLAENRNRDCVGEGQQLFTWPTDRRKSKKRRVVCYMKFHWLIRDRMLKCVYDIKSWNRWRNIFLSLCNHVWVWRFALTTL